MNAYSQPERSSPTDVPNGNSKYVLVVSMFVMAITTVFLFAKSNLPNSASTTAVLETKHSLGTKLNAMEKSLARVSAPLDFTLKRNNYDPLPFFEDNYSSDSMLQYKHLLGYDAVVEPYAQMKLHIYGGGVAENLYVLQICKSSDKTSCATSKLEYSLKDGVLYEDSSSVTIGCSATKETFVMTLFEYDSSAELISEATGLAKCSYVRREFRALHEDDLKDYMDAAFVLDSVSEEEGKKIYGSEYLDSSYTARLHQFHASEQGADHIHEGNGFFSRHVLLTNMYEQNLQVVDPSVTVPYWDYTIDNSEGIMGLGSPMFQPNTFGSLNVAKNGLYFTHKLDPLESAIIPDGRWANLKVRDTSDYPGWEKLTTSYGFMRSKWNTNPSDYLTRAPYQMSKYALPSCSVHYDQVGVTDFNYWIYNSGYQPHGSVHYNIGGFYGCDAMIPLLKGGYLESEDMLENWCLIPWTKGFYRAGAISMDEKCGVNSEDPTKTRCSFTCTHRSWVWHNVYSILANHYTNLTNLPEDAEQVWTDFFCGTEDEKVGQGSKIFSGDHVESSSAADPSFWPIHPTLERLWHAKLMVGGFEDETWYDNSDACWLSLCYQPSTDDFGADGCCDGHYENDRLWDAIAVTKEFFVGPTNGEVLAMTNPRSTDYSVTYIYDRFTWDHCVADSTEDNPQDINALLVDLAEETKTGIKKPNPHLAKAQAKGIAAAKERARKHRDLAIKFQQAKSAEKRVHKASNQKKLL